MVLMAKPRKSEEKAAEEPPKPKKRAQFRTDTRETD